MAFEATFIPKIGTFERQMYKLSLIVVPNKKN
jgi:hypothetical protein